MKKIFILSLIAIFVSTVSISAQTTPCTKSKTEAKACCGDADKKACAKTENKACCKTGEAKACTGEKKAACTSKPAPAKK